MMKRLLCLPLCYDLVPCLPDHKHVLSPTDMSLHLESDISWSVDCVAASRDRFTNMNLHWSQHVYVITPIIKCGMKLFIYSKTLMVQPLKFGNG